ncbi:hypothetical protein SAMN05661091_0881 [Paenibacillus uliginis N3/975]|uniref:Uncharacterized protein n=1 Tax=Paenibacillus uliginis N3/975 TaxID=1313296 RepID=A0A1X7GQ14_9BACL|nr:hypothetical protein [Paenibacillus uliginis]SMF72533.1 hypothetical protein SAMN05661091_0881 [Paenibacillus uliginis N3/975]
MAKGITAQEMDATTASGLVPHLGTTTNSGNAYSITTSADVKPNTKFTLKINAASSTAPTLKINNDTALPIKNANGNNAKLYASVYTLFRDGSAFILQGEGGEYGTATAADVAAGKTIGTENGIVTGTLVLPTRTIVNKSMPKQNFDEPIPFLVQDIFQIPASSKFADVYTAPLSTTQLKLDAAIWSEFTVLETGTYTATVELIDSNDVAYAILSRTTVMTLSRFSMGLSSFSIDRQAKKITYVTKPLDAPITADLTSNFNATGVLRFVARLITTKYGGTYPSITSEVQNAFIITT